MKTHIEQNREFQVGDKVFFKAKGGNISLQLGNCKKLVARFFRPFEVLNRIGPIAYELSLPPIVKIHNIFHVSLLNKYVYDSSHVIDWFVIQVEPEREFQVQPICILDKRTKILRNKAIG